jgi:predicted transcriptional regulator
MRVKYTEELALRAYALVETTEMTYKEIGEELKINGATVANWAKKVEKTPKLRKLGIAEVNKMGGKSPVKKTPVKKKKKTRSSGEGHKSLQSAIDLSNENAFLRWWLLGERQGFIEKLLKELGKE